MIQLLQEAIHSRIAAFEIFHNHHCGVGAESI
jgi:hypothetical protein